MISPISRLQVRLGAMPAFDPARDAVPPTDDWPDSWDSVPRVQRADLNKQKTGIEWVDRNELELSDDVST